MADERPTFMPDDADAVADEPIELPEHLQAEQPLPPRPEPEPEPVAEESEPEDEPEHAPGSFLAGLAGGAGRSTPPGGTAAAAESGAGSSRAVKGESGPDEGDTDHEPHPFDDDAKLAILLRGAIVAGGLGALVAILALAVVPEQLRISALLLAAILAGVAVSMGHVGYRAERMGQKPQKQLSRLATITGYSGLGVVVIAVLLVAVPLIFGSGVHGELKTAQEVSIGQCVMDPYATWDSFGDEIGTDDWWFDVVPCTQEHFGEISLVDLAPTYDEPTYAEGDSASLTECIAGFESYVGTPWAESSLTVEDYYPTGAAWDESPYVVCIVSGVDAATEPLAGSGL